MHSHKQFLGTCEAIISAIWEERITHFIRVSIQKELGEPSVIMAKICIILVPLSGENKLILEYNLKGISNYSWQVEKYYGNYSQSGNLLD